MSKTTDELLKILKRAKQPVEYIESQKEELSTKTLDQLLEEYMEKYKVEKAEVIKRSGLDRTYAYQIFSGRKQPSRNKLLALGIAIGMELDEVQQVLKCTGYPILYPKLERDSLIIFGIDRKVTLIELNELLDEMKQSILD